MRQQRLPERVDIPFIARAITVISPSPCSSSFSSQCSWLSPHGRGSDTVRRQRPTPVTVWVKATQQRGGVISCHRRVPYRVLYSCDPRSGTLPPIALPHTGPSGFTRLWVCFAQYRACGTGQSTQQKGRQFPVCRIIRRKDAHSTSRNE